MRVHISAKSAALTVLELLAFNAQKFLRGHVWTVPGNMHVKYVQRFKRVWLTGPLRTDTDTHIEQTHYLRHSVCSLDGDNKDNNNYSLFIVHTTLMHQRNSRQPEWAVLSNRYFFNIQFLHLRLTLLWKFCVIFSYVPIHIRAAGRLIFLIVD